MPVMPSGRQDALRGNTPRPSVPHSYVAEPPPSKLSPAEESLASAVAFHVGEILGSLTVEDPNKAASAKRITNYRRLIGALGAALIGLASWSASQIEAYGQSRADAATSALKAEAKAEEAARYLEETRQLAATAREVSEATSARVDQLDQKLDRLLRLAEADAR
ncbi:MAG: hypothetical protein ACRCZP_19750 [Phycicoccus sp.]